MENSAVLNVIMNTEEIIKEMKKKQIDYIRKNVSMVYLKKNIINYSNSKIINVLFVVENLMINLKLL